MRQQGGKKTAAIYLATASVRESLAGVAEVWVDDDLIAGLEERTLVICGPRGIVDRLTMTAADLALMRSLEDRRFDLDQTLAAKVA
jgi:hypothetical protein